MARPTLEARHSYASAIHQMLFSGAPLARNVNLISEFEQVLIAAGKLTVRYWKDKILPKHFERSAHGRYGYAERKRWYIGYKVRRWPESKGLDLIMSGRLKSQATGPPRTPPSGRRIGGVFVFKIAISTPDYVPKNQYIDMHGELTTSDRQDILEVWSVFNDYVRLGLFGRLS